MSESKPNQPAPMHPMRRSAGEVLGRICALVIIYALFKFGWAPANNYLDGLIRSFDVQSYTTDRINSGY